MTTVAAWSNMLGSLIKVRDRSSGIQYVDDDCPKNNSGLIVELLAFYICFRSRVKRVNDESEVGQDDTILLIWHSLLYEIGLELKPSKLSTGAAGLWSQRLTDHQADGAAESMTCY